MMKAMGAVGMLHALSGFGAEASAEEPGAVFELRVYHCLDGRLPALLKRFREHTDGLFTKHGMKALAYWTPLDEPLKGRTLFYILRFPSRDEATRMWAAFQADPEWVKVRDASEADGKIVERIESTYLELADLSKKA